MRSPTDLIISNGWTISLSPRSKNRLPTSGWNWARASRREEIQGRVPARSYRSCRKKEDELRNETSWESIERSEKLGGWVGGWEDVDLERAAEEARSRWKVGRGNQDVRFPQIPYPKVRQEVAAFPPFPSIFPAGLRAAGLIDTFNDSGKNGE